MKRSERRATMIVKIKTEYWVYNKQSGRDDIGSETLNFIALELTSYLFHPASKSLTEQFRVTNTS